MTSLELQPSGDRRSRLGRVLKGALRKISPSRGAGLSENNDRDEVHLFVDVEESKGPFGLNLLHDPPNPKIDFIFVHGLGGGSRKTWSSSPDAEKYWPKAWLSKDPEFSSVRIHSFGYDANWDEWKTSKLNVLDFARSLLRDMSNNRTISNSSTKIVLIGHSMGGIVIKKAYMMAQENDAHRSLATRVHTLYFLATPHRGSDYSKTLANILAVTLGPKTCVTDLSKDSTAIAFINDSFRHYANKLQLLSFYETSPTKFLGIQALIVDVDSATLGFPHESCGPLNANHSGVCKFRFESDSNYRTLRGCFINSIEKILTEESTALSSATALELEQLTQMSGIRDALDEDLLAGEDVRAEGTCEWLFQRPSYTSWQDGSNADRHIFWLSGNAGAGKSILCSRIVTHLQSKKSSKCSHFFFKNGDSQKSSLAMCLRSLATQMARADASVLRRLLESQTSYPCWDSWDDKRLWRKIFLDQLLKSTNQNIHYWVIDSVDECQKSQLFLSLLADTPSWLKVFFTSRGSFHSEENVSALREPLEYYQMQSEDTFDDLKILINAKIDFVPSYEKNREDLKQKILDKASGSFLWVSLVMNMLAKSYSEEAAEEILEEVPTDMNSLYSDMLGNVLHDPRAVVLAKSLFTWTLIALRPLKIESLQTTLKLDTNHTVPHLDKLIPAISGQLVIVNQHYEAEVIHQTAKSYLLHQEKHPGLVLDRLQCHTKMAQICLGILAGVSSTDDQPRKPSRHLNSFPFATTPDLADYACEYFSDHLKWSSTEDKTNWERLCKFLDCNVLAWIEFLATKRHMRSVTRTAQNLLSYFRRRIKHLSPICPQKAIMESWINDLFRLSAKFGTNLTLSPSSIHSLIPSICPSDSNISKYRTHTFAEAGFSMKGVMDKSWDDCLARIDYPNLQTSAVACGDQYSAVALTNGSIYLYFQESGQLKSTLNHCARAKTLLFSDRDQYLASAGQQKVKVWDTAQGALLWEFPTKHQILDLSFTDDENTLTGASQGNYILSWDLHSGEEDNQWQWTDSVRGAGEVNKSWPQPSKAVFSPDHRFLVVNYRGLPLHLFDPLKHKFLGALSRECETGVTGAVNVEAFAFNTGSEINVLIVSYADGELVVYDIESKQLRYRRPDVFAHFLKCSPNGRALVTGSSTGTIRIFEFAGARGERLVPLYTLDAQDDGIRGIAVSSDSLRIADIRGSQYRVWEPAVLSQNDMDEGSQSELSHPVSMEIQYIGMLHGQCEPEITAVHCHPNGDFVFCGKRDGSVSYFETKTAIHRQILYRHASDVGITCIMYIQDKQLLVTADESGRVLINKVTASETGINFMCHVNDIRSGQSLLLLLHDHSGTRMLLRGKKSTEIWTTEGHDLGMKVVDDGESLLLNHPSRPGYLVSVGHQAACVFSWEDGLKSTTSLDSKQEVNLMVTPPTPKPGQSTFTDEGVIEYQEQWTAPFLVKLHKRGMRNLSRLNSTTDMIQIWPASSVTDRTGMAPSIYLGNFGSKAHRIRQVIATAGNVLYFLDTDLWICSLDITNKSTVLSGAKRHCFLLSEWRGVDGGILVEYIPTTREFIVSRKHELLVISGGLEFEEPWV